MWGRAGGAVAARRAASRAARGIGAELAQSISSRGGGVVLVARSAEALGERRREAGLRDPPRRHLDVGRSRRCVGGEVVQLEHAVHDRSASASVEGLLRAAAAGAA